MKAFHIGNRMWLGAVWGLLAISILTADSPKNPTRTLAAAKNTFVVTFSGGCFWSMESAFSKVKGITHLVVGYTGGKTRYPTYQEVSSGETGHAESIQLTYDPAQVTYEDLLNTFWRNIDPTTLNQQFFDAGTEYRTVIYYNSQDQKAVAEKSKQALEASGKFKAKIVTTIESSSEFFPAEDYHQQYYKKNPLQYQRYRLGSGRDQYFESIWGKAQH